MVIKISNLTEADIPGAVAAVQYVTFIHDGGSYSQLFLRVKQC